LQLITFIGEQTCSLKEMMGLMALKNRENFLENYLNPSMEAGLVEALYPNLPKHPKQKYRLTEKGRTVLQEKMV
jgi:ATP-dependent DNA helicase RecG